MESGPAFGNHVLAGMRLEKVMANAAAFTANDSTDLQGSLESRAGSTHELQPEPIRGSEADDCVVTFGLYRCHPHRRLLLEGDTPVRLGSRAFDILVALLKRRGELVSKEELIAEVWPDTFVEEGNLRVHMAALRRALRDQDRNSRFICTVPGRGYGFIAPVSDCAGWPAASVLEGARCITDLPVSITPMFGRSDFLRSLLAQLPARRFVTIVGPGGMGKTRVAVVAAEALNGRYADGIRFVNLGAIMSAQEVEASLANALGIEREHDDPAAKLVSHLKDRRMLLVIDNCEHVIDAAASLIERILVGAPRVHILATSREPLRSAGEWVRRLPPLGFPPKCERLSAFEAMAYPAIELFVDRISASDQAPAFTDDNAPIVGEICRSLDGVPLAIELAAARAAAFGIRGLAAQLDQPLHLLSGGRRTGEGRHRSLSTMLDWSHRTLSDLERVVLRRLAVFPGEFTLSSAHDVAGDRGDGSFDVAETVASLVAKSLVMADLSDEVGRYRLLRTTRAYAFGKLSASGELDAVARRHAEHANGCRAKLSS
jgi:predicted ATPase/DNA-binding winged helix-turn-helix (wHTH) protein